MEGNIGATPLQLPRAAGQPEEHAFHHMTTWGTNSQEKRAQEAGHKIPVQEDMTISALGY